MNDDGKSTNVKVRYMFGYRINEERFFGLMASLCDVFNQVSIEEPEDILIPVERGEPFLYEAKRNYSTFTVSVKPELNYRRCAGNASCKDSFVLVLVRGTNKLRTVYRARKFVLDRFSGEVANAWFWRNNPGGSSVTTPRFNVIFNDDNNDSLYRYTIMPGDKCRVSCSDRCVACFDRTNKSHNLLLVKPWFDDGSSASCERYVREEMTIPRIAMPEIKRIKIEVVK